MSFSQPAAGGDNFTPAEHKGHLLLLYPKAYNPQENTTKGITEAADVDVVVVDKLGPNGQPLVFKDARVFGNLARSVRVLLEADGSPKKYLGRLDQGPNTKGTPPWILQNWTDADVAMATPVATAFEAGQFTPAVNPMSTPPAPPAAPAPAPPQQWQAGAAGHSPATAPPTAPAAPQWQPPAPAAAPSTPTPPAPTAAPAIDPNLVAFLASKGVTVPPGMDQATAEAIARSFPQ